MTDIDEIVNAVVGGYAPGNEVPALAVEVDEYARALDRWAAQGSGVPETDVALCSDLPRVQEAAEVHRGALDTVRRAEEAVEEAQGDLSDFMVRRRADRAAEVAAGNIETPLGNDATWTDELAKRQEVHILAIERAISTGQALRLALGSPAARTRITYHYVTRNVEWIDDVRRAYDALTVAVERSPIEANRHVVESALLTGNPAGAISTVAAHIESGFAQAMGQAGAPVVGFVQDSQGWIPDGYPCPCFFRVPEVSGPKVRFRGELCIVLFSRAA